MHIAADKIALHNCQITKWSICFVALIEKQLNIYNWISNLMLEKHVTSSHKIGMAYGGYANCPSPKSSLVER